MGNVPSRLVRSHTVAIVTVATVGDTVAKVAATVYVPISSTTTTNTKTKQKV